MNIMFGNANKGEFNLYYLSFGNCLWQPN